MKKTISVIIFVLLLMVTINVKAITVNELEDYLMSSHNIAGEKYELTATQKAQVEKYFETHEVSESEATNVMSKINQAVKKVEEVGDNKFSADEKTEILSLVNEAAAVLDLTVTYDSSDKVLMVYEDGVVISAVSLESTGLVQTGNTLFAQTICCLGIVIIAITLIIIVKKRTK